MSNLCKNCQKLLVGRWSKQFCCSSCAAQYNNTNKVNKKIKANRALIEDLILKETPICLIKKLLGISTDTFKRAYPNYKGKQGASEAHQTSRKKSKEVSREKIFKTIQQTGYTGVSTGPQNQKVWLKRFLIDRDGAKCCQCGWGETHPTTGNIMIELDHIDGNNKNNTLGNVRLLCPNCHSLTPTYRHVKR